MKFEDVKPGLRVQITSETIRSGRLFLKTATVLTVFGELSGSPYIRLRLEDGSAEIIHGISAEDLDFE